MWKLSVIVVSICWWYPVFYFPYPTSEMQWTELSLASWRLSYGLWLIGLNSTLARLGLWLEDSSANWKKISGIISKPFLTAVLLLVFKFQKLGGLYAGFQLEAIVQNFIYTFPPKPQLISSHKNILENLFSCFMNEGKTSKRPDHSDVGSQLHWKIASKEQG